MASLTPGVLLKLLQSMNTDARVAGEHRSSVLQVTGIVPSAEENLWPSRGFYLQLSDSANSTYVTFSDDDADVVLSSRPQLGQLVHVDRLEFAYPVPHAIGLRPVPGARPYPFLGSPDPLVACSSTDHRGFVIQPASPADAGHPFHFSSSLGSNPSRLEEENRTVFAAKENVVSSGKNHGDAAQKPRRFASPAAAKLAARKSGPGSGNGTPEQPRDPSPVLKMSSRPSSPALVGRAASRASSPIPSKCEVPSLVAAKEENRRAAREPAIIVPSRYRQPSPVRKAAASPMGRRGSMSPARRPSGGLKVSSPAAGEVGGKKKVGLVVAGISRASDALASSVKSIRKSWDDPSASAVGSESKEKGGSKSKVDRESILRTQVAVLRRLSDAGGLPNSTKEAASNEMPRTSSKMESFSESEKPNSMSPRVTVHDRKWTDGSVPFDSVSNNLARLGKEALQRRNSASTAAAEALEEALVTESVVRSLSMFSHLCSASKPGNPVPTIDRFLSVYGDVLRWCGTAESPSAGRKADGPKDAMLWVEAALATDLEVLHLISKEAECLPRLPFPQVDPPRAASSASAWTRGHGVSETVDLAKALRREMQIWFMKFVEEAMDVGFRLLGENADNNKVAAVLSQLKRINDWLDGVMGRTAEEEEALKEKIERLKRKIYGFVITHVGSAFDASLSLATA
ncbi:hypothetical protein MUK42_12512 [Musa troglodytarum]|uniref:Uncharacterized protein n=1 Tax=Musa troglodytarum TaxID=320322 RepID=A0A9E7GT80_9LILI|nr:hypothetical protein MUK42_12512 [Musa troglodytarum]